MLTKVVYSKLASRQMARAPQHITGKLLYWARQVEFVGIQVARQHPGYHDEPLQGTRFGQRSIRLSKKWRAIYKETSESTILIYVLEVTSHDYRTR